jgi:ABC-type transport system substrate-binding protein
MATTAWATIVPNVAKDYEWNSDFTTLTFMLRKGHKCQMVSHSQLET